MVNVEKSSVSGEISDDESIVRSTSKYEVAVNDVIENKGKTGIVNKDSICKNIPKCILPVFKDLSQLSEGWNGIKPNACSLIVFDLETSGLSVNQSEILQVSAVWKNKEFDAYVYPFYSIPPETSAVNKLNMVDGVLFHDGEPVDSSLLGDVLKSFFEWLSDVPSPLILIGHNVKRFDCPHFFAALSKHNFVEEFCELVIGFIDTLPLYREIEPGMPNYKQGTLVNALLGHSYEKHNAIEDVRALQLLISSTHISDFLFIKHSFTSESIWKFCQFDMTRKRNLLTYILMINKGITRGMANKFSQNGITYCDILHAFKKGGRDDVERLLGEEINGVVRGTQNRNVIARIIEYIEKEV